MGVTFGGRPLTTSPSLVKLSEEADKKLDHNHFGLWDSYISMQAYRAKAITTWTRREALLAKMDQAGDDHPDIQKAQERADGLQDMIRGAELDYLKAERDASAYWVALGEAQRVELEADTMFGLPASQEAILVLWRHPLGPSPLPPDDMRIDPTVLQFCPASQARAYSKEEGR